MLLAHISDTHFRSRGEKLYGFIDVNAANADVVSQLNALRERPDAVVVSGDIVNCGRPEEYQVARQILGSLNYPLYLIPGNHDDKAHFLEHLHPLCPQLGNDPQNMRYAVDDFATRLLFIDSSHAGTSKGWLTDETIGWLEAQLFEGGDNPATIFMPTIPGLFFQKIRWILNDRKGTARCLFSALPVGLHSKEITRKMKRNQTSSMRPSRACRRSCQPFCCSFRWLFSRSSSSR